MATYYYIPATGNVDDANAWATNAGGPGDTTATDRGDGVYIVGAAGNTLDLNGHGVTMNRAIQAALLQAITGTLTVSGTRAIYGDVTYNGTSTSGMIQAGASTNLTIYGKAKAAAAGYLFVASSSTATLAIANAGGTAVENQAAGRVISANNPIGPTTITGAVLNSSSGYAIYLGGGQPTTIIGNCTNSGSGACVFNTSNGAGAITGDISVTGTGYGLRTNVGTGSVWTIDGDLDSGIVGGTAILMEAAGTTVVWINARTLAAGKDCCIRMDGGTLALANASGALSLACSGHFGIYKRGGTLVTSASGNTAAIVRQIAAAGVVGIGCQAPIAAITTGPTLPEAKNVYRGATQFGYAGALVTPLGPRPRALAGSLSGCVA